ncbi:MAG: glycosyltransferase family 1 protein [Chitinophagaceae bacterium]|nr:glycosyltransferase family 1 protein [Chitinophagaceae bacterium]
MDLICFSHLRWNFVYQRPQHILSRMAKHFRILFVEEPIFDTDKPYLDTKENSEKVWVIVPHLQQGLAEDEINNLQESLLQNFFEYFGVKKFIAWYYTPMALGITGSFSPDLVVFDCMDELSAFKNAPPLLIQREKELLANADVVFTGGSSLYEAKKDRHPEVYLFPSSIDKKHFEKARSGNLDLIDQMEIPYPRIGFFGVIDERMDIDLLREMANMKPEWQFIIIGPVVKIDPATLPTNSNIHYLGSKSYQDLPYYLSGWDVAMMPFAMNESTRFISPTKTPEYLAAGKPVVSTPVHDVVKSYGDTGLVEIAANAEEFIEGIQKSLDRKDNEQWLKNVDEELATNSWDITCDKMLNIIQGKLKNQLPDNKITQKEDEYV